MKLRDLPIARKLALLVAVNTLIALVLISLVFTVGAALKVYRDTQEELLTLAMVIGENSRAALAFGDSRSATDTLAALRARAGIAAARLVDPLGIVFASYAATGARADNSSAPHRLVAALLPTTLSMSYPIAEGAATIGSVEIEADISHVWLGLARDLALIAMIAMALTALALFFGLRLHRIVTVPLTTLASVSRHVSRQKDYGVRASKRGDDEIGALVDDFNHMLAEIETRDAALRAERETLEQRVAERTAQLSVAKDEAERANAAKSEFLSRMSHELRTPLNAILGFAQLLAGEHEAPLAPQQADNVREILRAGDHLLTQVNEILDLARVESGRIELNFQAVPLAALAAECVARVRPLAERHRISITPDIAADLGVRADYGRLAQVLLNLLSNAIKYNRDHGWIRVSAVPTAFGLRIEVRDSGRGIAASQMARLFKPFERLESSYDGIEGTGIGLALVKMLVEAMDGTIGVDSEVGVGSCFHVELRVAPLPVAEEVRTSEHHGAIPPRSDALAPPRTAAPDGGRHCVLYIEDNPSNLKLVRKMLASRTDLALIDAHDAESGLEIARREKPRLILVDINLPGMDGFAALRHLRADPATAAIPVVAVTANAMRRDIERGLAAGFAAYLTKPLDFGTFIATIDRCLGARQGETP
jgi:signal transduction histidine kinase/CheY-like chemotaxis protein